MNVKNMEPAAGAVARVQLVLVTVHTCNPKSPKKTVKDQFHIDCVYYNVGLN